MHVCRPVHKRKNTHLDKDLHHSENNLIWSEPVGLYLHPSAEKDNNYLCLVCVFVCVFSTRVYVCICVYSHRCASPLRETVIHAILFRFLF